MSQANWTEYFRTQSVPESQAPEQHALKLPGWVTDWEQWLTLALALLVFLSVARSVESAHWVERMPSLTLLSFLGICAGLALARIRWPEPFLYILALLIGVPIVLWLTLGYIHAPALHQGLAQFWHRYSYWLYLLRSGGISDDDMPFVVLVLAFTWIAAFLSSWSIFRWRNAWLALIPGGVGLLTNISYLPAQNSLDFVIFLFGAMLLVMRLSVANRERLWKAKGLPYPDFLSLTLLNSTTWVAAALLLVAWTVPLAGQSPAISEAWSAVTSPFTNMTDWNRLFSSIDSKRDVPLHTFGATLPLQGKAVLSDRIVAEVDFGDQTDYGRDLRAAVYDQYTAEGWKVGSRQNGDLGANGVAGSNAVKSADKDRKEVPVSVTVDSPIQALLTVGEPVGSTTDTRAEVINSGPEQDIGAVRPRHPLRVGENYTVKGSISQASVESLQAAPASYPDWIKGRYLQLPTALPGRVRELAQQWTQGKTDPYDKAIAIEAALRNYPETYDIPSVPPDRDAVDYFLFDLKRGYSDYHASAMVVMLRSLGVPARLATGFSVGELDLNVHRYVIREKDAISWPEVYFPGYGWEEFSPFGGAPLINRPSAADNTSASAADSADPGADPGAEDDTGDTGGSGQIAISQSPSLLHQIVLYGGISLLVLMALSVVGGVGARVAWDQATSGLAYPEEVWEKTVRLASWLKLPPGPHETPSEYSRSLSRNLPDAEGIDVVATAYARSRYGRKQLNEAEQQRLRTAWLTLRNYLFRLLLHLRD